MNVTDSSSLYQQYNDYLNIDIKPNNIIQTNIATKELDGIVQSQQTEINNLKTENSLLKSKLNELLEIAGKETI